MGGFCDPSSPFFDPIACGTGNPFGDGGGPAYGGGQQNVNVYVTVPPLPIQVTVPASIGTNIANGLTGVISSALEGLGKQVGGILEGLAAVILSGVGNAIHDIGKFIVSGFDSIVGALGKLSGAIGTALSNVFGPIFSGLESAVKGIGSILKDISNAFLVKVDALIQAIKDNGALAIIPVLQAIATSINLVRGVISAIQLDIHAGARALILLPTQIADSLTSLDATLTRALQQIGFTQGAKLSSDVTFPPGTNASSLIDSLNTGFTLGAGLGVDSSSVQDFITLSTACQPLGHDWLLNKLSNLGAGQWDWLKKLEQFLLDIPIFFTQLAGLLEQQIELTREDVNNKCPIRKLDPANAIEAALRQFIDSGTLREELRVQGYDDNRISLLRKLAIQRLAPDILFDSWYRDLIDTATRDSGLSALGFSADQIRVLEGQSVQLPTLNDALRWWNFGEIDEGAFDTMAESLRISPEVIKNIKATYQTRATVQQQILLDGRLKAIGSGYIPESSSLPFDPIINDAASREQLGGDNVQLQWQAHWNLPSYLAIIQGYFRQLRTLDSVQKAMQAENIPQEFWDELITLQRPLLPFRSIPGYLATGIISDADAIAELSGHGFDPLRIQWILEFARRAKKPAASAQVAGVGQLSIATARTLFDDGAITEDQYISVLEQHKFPHDIAVLQANADTLAAHAKARKQAITDLIDETLAGIVTVDDTIANLTKQGFTPVEIARYEKGVRRAKAGGAKHPSVSEMKAFLKAGFITGDQFKAELELQGWTDPWLTAWIQLDVAPGH